MTIVRAILVIIFLVPMLFITGFCFSSDFRSSFGGPIDTKEAISINIALTLCILTAFTILSVLFIKKPGTIRAILCLLLIPLWFLTGRTVGVEVVPEGKIFVGWFYLTLERYDICTNNDDCETILYSQTKIKELPFWRLEIENKNIHQIIFVGPFSWSKTLKMFNTHIHRGNMVVFKS